MTDKQPVPAAVLYKNTGNLPTLEWNWVHIMHVCREALTTDKKYVILPVEETQEYKPQKRRLIKDDKASPKGLIQRDRYARERYYPYASARFNAEELVKYAAEQFNALSAADLERMAGDAVNSINS